MKHVENIAGDELFALAMEKFPKETERARKIFYRESHIESIEHWKRLADYSTNPWLEGIGAKYCPLCNLHQKEEYEDESGSTESACGNCPVRAATGYDYCEGTPYYDARRLLYAAESPDKDFQIAAIIQFRNAARKMEEFLRAILPCE
jgi:hypothetical protein